MNGAERLCEVLLANGIDTCFANPGTSEMHFVAALDRQPEMHCVLGLAEGVVTGMADGYARMADKPAATLLHLGPGLANGLANLHNAKRAKTPMVNVVGDHAGFHLQYDAPLTSDVDAIAQPMSQWLGRVTEAAQVRSVAEEAIEAARSMPGVATMVLQADAAWSEAPDETVTALAPHDPKPADEAAIREAANLIRTKTVALFLGDKALREDALLIAGKIAAATGVELFLDRAARWQRGAGRVAARQIPYRGAAAYEALEKLDVAILIGGRRPANFFGYPGKRSELLPEGCQVVELASPADDLRGTLERLADELGAHGHAPAAVHPMTAGELPRQTGTLTADAIGIAVARQLPENAIIADESLTSGLKVLQLSHGMQPHDHLTLTGGSIGIGIPLATGAAVAARDRKVVCLQADGSGMYTLQGLWTQARERLDVVTVIFSNRSYAILKNEMRNVGVEAMGDNARRMLDLDDPALDWCSLARGMGVEAARAETCEQFEDLFAAALGRRGPFLIEAII